MRGCNHWRRGR